MWKCPKCSEEIEDQFDSCWKCVKPAPTVTEPPPRREERPARGTFFRNWGRGWFVLLFAFCLSLGFQLVAYLLTSIAKPGNALLGLATVLFVLLFLPWFAYRMFTFFFGADAWPWGKGKDQEPPAEEAAAARLDEATKLEARGQVKEALLAYAEVNEKFPGTAAGRDAQKSLESLRSQVRSADF